MSASTTARRPGALSRRLQHTANARTAKKVRTRGGPVMGMDLILLHTVGRRSGTPRTNPLAFVDDGARGWIVVASGGGERNPDWYDNLLARPSEATVERHGHPPVPVTPQVLDGPTRDEAWQRLTAAISSLAKYQAKAARSYPVVRLTPTATVA